MNAYKSSRRVYSLDEARHRVNYWQRRLGLSDWEIAVKFVRQHEFGSNTPLLGEVSVLRLKQIALIKLLDPIDFVSDYGFIKHQDMELTIIHEMLHVRLDGMTDDAVAVRELSEERAVHALSMALAAMKDDESYAFI